MAEYFDKSFGELVAGAPKVVRNGLTGTRMIVYPDPVDEAGKINSGVIVEYNSTGKVMGTWPIREGRAYRGTPNKVKSLPFIEADNNFPRRFCREKGIPLTFIKEVKRGEEVYFGRPHNQGDSRYRSIGPDDPPVMWLHVVTIDNPSWVYGLLVVKEELPRTYEEFIREVGKTYKEQE